MCLEELTQKDFELMNSPSKVGILAMVQNRLVVMTKIKPYSGSEITQKALNELLSWIGFPLDKELENLGHETENQYVEIPIQLHTKDFDSVLMENETQEVSHA